MPLTENNNWGSRGGKESQAAAAVAGSENLERKWKTKVPCLEHPSSADEDRMGGCSGEAIFVD